ncbi:MAG: hypothetical protein M5U34_24230 [Chloroflexi bacterium]|nr:hypothetical protein [Chloroflexota bacterium]
MVSGDQPPTDNGNGRFILINHLTNIAQGSLPDEGNIATLGPEYEDHPGSPGRINEAKNQ